MTGNQTAVYPLPRPGGWPIIGVTPLTLVDEQEEYFPIAVGDILQFEAISANEFEGLKGRRL
jgi:inhibitor of KinA